MKTISSLVTFLLCILMTTAVEAKILRVLEPGETVEAAAAAGEALIVRNGSESTAILSDGQTHRLGEGAVVGLGPSGRAAAWVLDSRLRVAQSGGGSAEIWASDLGTVRSVVVTTDKGIVEVLVQEAERIRRFLSGLEVSPLSAVSGELKGGDGALLWSRDGAETLVVERLTGAELVRSGNPKIWTGSHLLLTVGDIGEVYRWTYLDGRLFSQPSSVLVGGAELLMMDVDGRMVGLRKEGRILSTFTLQGVAK